MKKIIIMMAIIFSILFASQVFSDDLILHRITRDCATNQSITIPTTQVDNRPGITINYSNNEMIIDLNVFLGGTYTNYKCSSRYQEQCIDDGTFDSWEDEWCTQDNNTVSSLASASMPGLNSLNMASSNLGMLGGFLAFFAVIMFVMILFAIAAYIYTSLTFMNIAKKTKTEPSWLAWIPIANSFLLPKIAKMHWWPILIYLAGLFFGWFSMILGFASGIGILFSMICGLTAIFFLVYLIIWMWKICKRLQRPGWWSILVFIPFFGIIWIFIMLGILAWDSTAVEASSVQTTIPKPPAAPVNKTAKKNN